MGPINQSPSFEIRQSVLQEVGKENIRSFELWAFKVSPVKYSRGVLVLWNMIHDSKNQISEKIPEGLDQIIKLWKEIYES